jgi:hypothetical protein
VYLKIVGSFCSHTYLDELLSLLSPFYFPIGFISAFISTPLQQLLKTEEFFDEGLETCS